MVQLEGDQDFIDEAKKCFERNITNPWNYKIKHKECPLPLSPNFKVQTENIVKVWRIPGKPGPPKEFQNFPTRHSLDISSFENPYTADCMRINPIRLIYLYII